MTSKTRLSILLVSTPVLAFVIVGGLIGQERLPGDRSSGTCACSKTWSRW